ncbi:oligosaccharide flippase family protein, partial [Vibrio sp. 10N.222.52.B7]|uniref:oligosaccharide flippase family protein n=1 Tax=Vibrio sp. 10N.222.52.B7 TaxID=3229629 RepID=UPI003553834A
MTLAEGLSLLVFYLCSSRYFPKIRFSFQALKDMYSFGALLMLSSLVRTTYENILTIIFGKSFGIKDLGYYYQANKFSSAFINAVTLIINKAAFPMIVNSINSGRDSLHEMRELTRVVC